MDIAETTIEWADDGWYKFSTYFRPSEGERLRLGAPAKTMEEIMNAGANRQAQIAEALHPVLVEGDGKARCPSCGTVWCEKGESFWVGCICGYCGWSQ